MRVEDRKQFAQAIGATFTLYGQAVTDDVIRLWWNVLDGYKLDAVLSALSYHVADYQGYGHRLPTPADIRKHLEVTLPGLAEKNAYPEREAYRKAIADIDEQAHITILNKRAGNLSLAQAKQRLAELSAQKISIQRSEGYIAANTPLNTRDDTAIQQQEPSIAWMPPFLRRGFALLTGKRA